MIWNTKKYFSKLIENIDFGLKYLNSVNKFCHTIHCLHINNYLRDTLIMSVFVGHTHFMTKFTQMFKSKKNFTVIGMVIRFVRMYN